ncbi:phage major capsid protein, P2 family [Lysobacter sp. CA199]|uniref:phage major capsid protein, P2 family n=1 Tax=Lysobacter sp. CA199 TaxID=3455608 RepID=UPI003F8D41C7
MRNPTRQLYNALLQQIATLNGIEQATAKFSVAPNVQQTLESRIQESSDFLKRINIIGVNDQGGAKIGLGVGGPIASTTDTTQAARATKDPTEFDESGYFCTQTNYDTHLTYAKLDAWAKFPDFQIRVRDAILRRQALDRIMIGFNGRSRAATSNATTNPLLQDVNKGWLQKYRDFAPARVLKQGATANVIKVGAGAGTDYKNLDALVMDAVAGLVAPWHQRDTQLVAILGADLLHDKYFPIVNQNNPPTEQLAADLIISQSRVGNRTAVQAPYVPDGTILITRLDNLSLYFQEGGRRRHITENPSRDRVENFESSNDAYVVEDYSAGCLIENIQIVQP